jgi:hypothetical protein
MHYHCAWHLQIRSRLSQGKLKLLVMFPGLKCRGPGTAVEHQVRLGQGTIIRTRTLLTGHVGMLNSW